MCTCMCACMCVILVTKFSEGMNTGFQFGGIYMYCVFLSIDCTHMHSFSSCWIIVSIMSLFCFALYTPLVVTCVIVGCCTNIPIIIMLVIEDFTM